jgi:hypothetical protein
VAGPSADWSLLLRACRSDVTGLGDGVAERFPGRRASDWAGVLALMDAQGVGPLAGSALLSVDPDLLPLDVREALHERVQLGSLRERVLVPELLGILEAFEARGVETIAYKGPALSAMAYGRAGIRDSVDLDLVVRESDVASAEEVLRRRGYRRHNPPGLRPRVEAAWRAAGNAAEFVSGDEWVFVDLHWRLFPARFPFRVDPARLWSRPARVRLGSREVRVFPAATLVGLLCLHGAKDRWRRLIWLCDVDRLIRVSPSLDWKEVCRFAEEGRYRRAAGLGLLLANRLLETPLPPAVLKWLARDQGLVRLAASVEGQLVAGGIDRPWWLEIFNVWPFHLEVFDTWRDGARYVGRTLLTPEAGDWELLKVRLPDPLFPLYSLLRPPRQLATLVRESVRRAFRLKRR